MRMWKKSVYMPVKNKCPRKGIISDTESSIEKASETMYIRNRPSFLRNQFQPQDWNLDIVEHWASYVSKPGKYYGGKAKINVWGLNNIKPTDVSAATIWVINVGDGSQGNAEVMQAGWHIYPELYGSYEPYFYVAWTADGFQKTGCHDLRCEGFVLNNSTKFPPGRPLAPLSQLNGEQRYIPLRISRDPQTGDWSLYHGDGDETDFVGYWPKTLFRNLANSATNIEWGGSVSSNPGGLSPPMGSGEFPERGEKRAAWFKHIQYVNSKGNFEDPGLWGQDEINDKKDCYRLGPFIEMSDGWSFYYGGPGGCKD